MEDLHDLANQLLDAARKLPPGQKRQNALREIGILRSRMCQLLGQAAKSKSGARHAAAVDH